MLLKKEPSIGLWVRGGKGKKRGKEKKKKIKGRGGGGRKPADR